MADLEKLRVNLEKGGFAVSCFDTAAQAADYLDGQIDGKTVGIGGSMTVKQLGVADRLAGHNTVIWHWDGGDRDEAARAQVYLSSVNGLAETGEIVNIDGTGNRVASTIYGHDTLYLVVGINKIAPDYDQALWRARNISAPLNAKRLGCKTPCVTAGHCCDCASPDRICRALSVLWCKPGGISHAEVILVNEELGL